MERHFCDVCNNLIDSPKDSIEMKIGRSYSPNPHIVIKEMCDECAGKLVTLVQNEVRNISKSSKGDE